MAGFLVLGPGLRFSRNAPHPSKPSLEILITEFLDDFILAVFPPDRDGRQRHSVEGIVFHHRVNGHIFKYQPVPNGYLFLKAVIPFIPFSLANSRNSANVIFVKSIVFFLSNKTSYIL